MLGSTAGLCRYRPGLHAGRGVLWLARLGCALQQLLAALSAGDFLLALAMKSGPVSISCGHRELQSFRRLAPGNYNMCIRGLQHKRIRKFSKDDRRSRHERQSRHIEHGDDEVGKLRPVERRKYAQNSQEEHCP